MSVGGLGVLQGSLVTPADSFGSNNDPNDANQVLGSELTSFRQ